MKIKVMGQVEARKASFNLSGKTAIISIQDMTGSPVKFHHDYENIIGILRLFFNDENRSCSTGMTEQDAKRIVEFVKTLPEDVELIIHCVAGISRSAGVAVAVLRWLNEDDSMFWSPTGMFAPNVFVARLVLREFGIFVDNFDELWDNMCEQFSLED